MSSAKPTSAAPSGASSMQNGCGRRFRLACRLLRNAGHLDQRLPGQRQGESLIDALVRLGVAGDPWHAAEALLAAKGLQEQIDELLSMGIEI